MAMGDIAFNLLIFFVILARAQDDSHIRWTPPKSPDIEAAPKMPVRLAISESNTYYFNGINFKSTTGLADRIREQLKGVKRKDRVVQFKVHAKAPVEKINPLIIAISEAGADIFFVLDKK